MSGLLRRIKRPGAAEETRTEPIAPPDPAHGSAPASPAPSEDGQRLPAGIAPEDVERRSVTGRRSKLRRRARFLRRARELALRDLGGLVYEARRREQDPGKLAEEKVQRLIALDAELNELDAALGATRGETVLREPGVGGTCARCGELHGSDATFCAHCGANLAEAAREAAAAEAERRAAAERAASEKAAAEQAAERPQRKQAAAETAAAEEAEADNAAAGKAEADKAGRDAAGRRDGRGGRSPPRPSPPLTPSPPAATAASSRPRRPPRSPSPPRPPTAAHDGRRDSSARRRPQQRACPRCGAQLAPDQEWCLSCGTAVGTRIAPTPRWRLPIVLVGTVLALLVAALVLSLVELGGDPQPVAKAPTPRRHGDALRRARRRRCGAGAHDRPGADARGRRHAGPRRDGA